jgi:hypothetical protein
VLLSALSKHMNEKIMHKFLQETIALTNFNQTDNIRAVGGILLGAIAKAKKKADPEVVRKIYSLSQDPASFVRKIMCGSLKVLFQFIDLKGKVMEEILKLVGDQCEEVIEEALKVFIKIFPDCENKDSVVESVEEQLLDDRCGKLTSVKLRFCGPLLTLMSKVMSGKSKAKWVDWVFKMTQEGSECEQIAASQTFGGVLQADPSNQKVFQIWNVLQGIHCEIVQQNLATQLAFFCVYSAEYYNRAMVHVKFFLTKPQFISLLLPQMVVVAGALKSHEEPLGFLLERFREPITIRDRVELIRQLTLFLNKFPCITQLKPLFPDLLNSLKSSTEPVKEKTLELLSMISYKTPGHSIRLSLFKEITNTLAYSSSCYLRSSFIQFCLHMKSICSSRMFNRFFMSPLLSLATDKTLAVRMKFLSNFVSFRYLVPEEDTEMVSRFRKILNSFLEQENKELINLALRADEMMDDSRIYQEAYGSAAQEQEKVRVKFELEEESKEVHEVEPVKKKELEVVVRVNKKIVKRKSDVQKESIRQNSVRPTKKYLIAENERLKTNLNRSGVRTIRKK